MLKQYPAWWWGTSIAWRVLGPRADGDDQDRGVVLVAESLMVESSPRKEWGLLWPFSLFALAQKLWTQGKIQLDFMLRHLGHREKFLFIYEDEHFRRAENTSEIRGGLRVGLVDGTPFHQCRHADILEERGLTLDLLVPLCPEGGRILSRLVPGVSGPTEGFSWACPSGYMVPATSLGGSIRSLNGGWQLQQYEQQHEAGLVALRASRDKASATVHRAIAGAFWLHGDRRHS